MKKLLVLLCTLLLISGCSNKKVEEQVPVIEEEEIVPYEDDYTYDEYDPEVVMPVFLEDDLEEGKISSDDYVRYSIFGSLDSNILPEEYRKNNLVLDFNGALSYADEHFDELSDETIEALAELLTLSNITFDDGSTANASIDGLLGFNKVSASSLFEIHTCKMDNVMVTSDENFIIWYTEKGDGAIAKSSVEKIADGLVKCVEKYNSIFNCEFNFEQEVSNSYINDNVQRTMLSKNGYNPDLVGKCLNVFIYEYSNDGIGGAYVYAPTLLEKIFYKIPDTSGIYAYPYFAVDCDADVDSLVRTSAHELFHHYQNQILIDDNQKMKSPPDMGQEATAVWASQLIYSWASSTDETLMNNVFTTHLDDIFNTFGKSYPTAYIGYTLSSFVYNYQNNVSDSLTKIIDGVYADDFITYLHNEARTEERAETMKELAYHSYAQDYNLEAFNGDPHKNIVNVRSLSSGDLSEIRNINRMAVQYYSLNDSDLKYGKLTINSTNSQVRMLLIHKSPYGDVSLCGVTDPQNTTLDLSAYASANGNLVLAVYNTSFVDAAPYTLSYEKTISPNGSILNSAATVLDNNDAKVIVNDIRIKGENLYLDCSIENKTDKELKVYLKDLYFNRYKIWTVEFKASSTVAAKSSNDCTLSFNEFDFSAFKTEEIGSIEFGFEISGKDGTPAAYTTDLYKLQMGGTETSLLDAYNAHLDTAHYCYSTLNGEDGYSYSNVLGYQKDFYSDDRMNITGVMVVDDANGSQTIVMDVEKLNDEPYGSIDFTITAINDINTIIFSRFETKCAKGHRQVIAFIADNYTFKDREAGYGLSSVGSYELSIVNNSYKKLAILPISFGEVSFAGGTKVFENERCVVTLTGAVTDDIQTDEQINLVFRIDVKDDEFARNEWSYIYFDEVYKGLKVDGVTAEDTYEYHSACDYKQSAYVWIEIKDVDATIPHQITGQFSVCTKKVDISVDYTPNIIEY